MFGYEKDPAEIYRQSFATVRSEADLSGLSGSEAEVAVRLIHACGMVEIAKDIHYTAGAVEAGIKALNDGAPVLVDCEMAGAAVIRSRLPVGNQVICTLNDPSVPDRAKDGSTTRSAAAVDLWLPHLEGAVVTIGNAPTALFRLLELLSDGAPKPAVILGFPVGFVGAAESKQALIDYKPGLPAIALKGRRGGSAMAGAAVNALARQGDHG